MSDNQTIQVNWPVPPVNYTLQEADTLATPGTWHVSALSISSNNNTFTVSMPVTDQSRFFRLAGVSPASAEGYITNGLVACWRMDDGAGTIAADSQRRREQFVISRLSNVGFKLSSR